MMSRAGHIRWLLPGSHENQWLALFFTTRAVSTATAISLLAVHRVTPYDRWLILIALGYGVSTMAAFARSQRLQQSPPAWAIDAMCVLALIVATQDWRSPFYLLGLTALVLPCTTMRHRHALAFGLAYTAGYLVAAIAVGLNMTEVRTTARVETVATHLMVPGLVTLALAYAAEMLKRLGNERARAERLAVESERRRIAWELHDSAKQRVHAAHLVVSSVQPAVGPDVAERLCIALAELTSATADMEASLTDLRTPLETRPLERALRERAEELAPACGIPISVHGRAPGVPSMTAAHAYRIACEALTNAVRHSGASRVDVHLDADHRRLQIVVEDDGCGMPATTRPGAGGVRSMRDRANSIGATLTITSPQDAAGTTVRLEVPISKFTNGATP